MDKGDEFVRERKNELKQEVEDVKDEQKRVEKEETNKRD